MIIWTDELKKKILKLKREADIKRNQFGRECDYEASAMWVARGEAYKDVLELLDGC